VSSPGAPHPGLVSVREHLDHHFQQLAGCQPHASGPAPMHCTLDDATVPSPA
jgi:hypothetical protein